MRKVPDFNKNNIVLIVIDMQYNDGSEGYYGAYNWENTVSNCKLVLDACRSKGYPIVHIMVAMDPDGVLCHPLDPRDKDGKPICSVKGARECEIVDELKPLPGEILIEKQRDSAFYQTNLDLALQGLKAEHLIMIGCFTDSCYLTSVYDAFQRGFTISIVKDACTAGTDAAHKTSILTMANWIYGCSIFNAKELVKALNNEKYNAWFWDQANSMPFELHNIEELYQKLDIDREEAEQ